MNGQPFIPPYPVPHRSKLSQAARFYRGMTSWIHTLFEKSYTMKMGEIKLPGVDFFIPNETELVRRVMDDPQQFPKHKLLWEMLYPLIGDGVFSINGEAWAQKREMMNPAFAHTNLRRTFATMNEAVTDMIGRIEARDLSQPLHIDPLMTHVAADVIYRTILSRSLNEQEAKRIFDAFERYQKIVQPSMLLRTYGLPAGFLRRKLQHTAGEIHAVFGPIIHARHADFHAGREGPHDILHSLLQAKHPVTGEAFTYRQLVDEVSIIFLAGHETSASALSWALYLIASCPEVQQALQREVAEIGAIDVESIKRLELVRNVFRETLRLYPPVSFFMREVQQATEMRGKRMKAGSLLVISPWLLQRNKNNFPCPHAFMPERFNDAAQQEACRSAYMPFGRGPRVCIGAGFAQQEAALVLAHIVRRFHLSVPHGMVPEPVSRLTLRAKHGIRLNFQTRIDSHSQFIGETGTNSP